MYLAIIMRADILNHGTIKAKNKGKIGQQRTKFQQADEREGYIH